MLRKLSGRSHFVFTGVTVACDGRMETAICRTEVFFKDLSEETISAYLRTGEPYDKAGSYGIQGKGALLVDHIDGDYANVVGLPVSMLDDLLREFGIRLL
jgi:septum formation protein